MTSIHSDEILLYKKIDLPSNNEVTMTKECLKRILKHLGNQGEYGCPIDEDLNHWLFFDHGHNIMTITYTVFGDDCKMVDKNKVKVALTGNWKEDVIYGIKKALED